MLEIEDLHAGYGALAVVHGVSLRVGERECVALIGPNGAGKTTLFNLVLGYLRPTRGTVSVFGEDVTGLKPFALARRGLR